MSLVAAIVMMANVSARTFSFCYTGGGENCIVDGDTLWVDRTKIRISNIDAPETHNPRCAVERARGDRSTEALIAWVNAGPFELIRDGRDVDRFGRKLRRLTRGGQDAGQMLIDAGLARLWDGARHPWC